MQVIYNLVYNAEGEGNSNGVDCKTVFISGKNADRERYIKRERLLLSYGA